jgi:hypothetical protein
VLNLTASLSLYSSGPSELHALAAPDRKANESQGSWQTLVRQALSGSHYKQILYKLQYVIIHTKGDTGILFTFSEIGFLTQYCTVYHSVSFHVK